MFDVGFLELMLIGIVALVVIGPERLPDVARTLGTYINKAQRFVRGVKSDIASELRSGELKDLLGDQRQQISELRQMVQSTKRDLQQTTADAMKTARSTFDELEESAADAGIVKPRHSARKALPSAASTDAASAAVPAAGTDTGLSAADSSTVDLSKPGAPVALDKPDAPVAEPLGGTPQASAEEPASDAVSRPVNTGPREGSWASGIVSPDASPRGSDN